MANQLDVNPWIIDTVMANPYKAYVHIRDIYWTDQVNVGDRLVVKDQNGRIIIDSTCDAINDLQRFGKFDWVNGLQVTTLTSGKVTVSI